MERLSQDCVFVFGYTNFIDIKWVKANTRIRQSDFNMANVVINASQKIKLKDRYAFRVYQPKMWQTEINEYVLEHGDKEDYEKYCNWLNLPYDEEFIVNYKLLNKIK